MPLVYPARPTLVFTSGATLFQALVKVVSTSRIDHVAIGLGEALLHAREDGVVLERRENWLRKNEVIAEVEILPDVSRGILYCLDHIGQPYDKPGLLRIALGLVLRRGLSPLQSWTATPGAHTCAAFAMLIDPDGSRIVEWQDIPRRAVLPVDLFDALGPSFRPIVQPPQGL